jgi:hypothetical protein
MSCLVFPASHALSSQQLMHKLPAKHNDDSAHDFQPSAAAPTSLSGESNEVQGQQPLRRAGEGGAGVRRASTSQAGSPPEVGHASDQEDRRCTRCRSFPRRPGRCRRRPVGQVTLVRQLEAAAAQGLCCRCPSRSSFRLVGAVGRPTVALLSGAMRTSCRRRHRRRRTPATRKSGSSSGLRLWSFESDPVTDRAP